MQLAALQAQFSKAETTGRAHAKSHNTTAGVDALAELLGNEELAGRLMIVGINDLSNLQTFLGWTVERRRSVLKDALKLSDFQAEVMVQQIEAATTRCN